MNKIILLGLMVTLLGISACEPTDTSYTIPTTYNFENVSYTNQTRRVEMLNELANYAKTANTAGVAPLDAQVMKDMYSNSGAPFSSTDLNTATAQLKDKTVLSLKSDFEAYMDAMALMSQNTNQTASAGQAGIMTSNTTVKSYLLNENGLEMAQIIEKCLAGAVLYYQSTEIYFGSSKMAVDNRVVTAGKGTTMEHHWDEAFGYYGAPVDFPGNSTDLLLWAKYSNKVNPVLGCNSTIMDGFLEGRAAISASDYDTRDAMIEKISTEWERVSAAVAISYMNDAKTSISDPAIFHHNLTEAYAFIWNLKYGRKTALSDAKVDAILVSLAGSADVLQANLYNTTAASIDATINMITADFTSLESVKSSL